MKLVRLQQRDAGNHLRTSPIWSIEVDSNNLQDLVDLEKRVRSRICQLKVSINGTKNDIKKSRFDACNEIYLTDIRDLYKDLLLDPLPEYYVYAHSGTDNIAIGKDGVTTWLATEMGLSKIPFYIGKGTADRAYDLNRNETHRKVRQKLKTFGKDIEVTILKNGLSELDALCLESKLIDIMGLMGKGGKLVNLDEGIRHEERRLRYANYLSEINTYYKNSLKVI